jgi:tetratricopeptide (TPR) repeat protein
MREVVPARRFELRTLGLKLAPNSAGRLLKPPAELNSPHLASPWLLETPRLGNTNWLYIRGPLRGYSTAAHNDSMTPEEILDRARASDDSLAADPAALAQAVRAFVEAGSAASALELVGRAWRAWTSSGRLEEGRAAVELALNAGRDTQGVWRARALYADGVIAFRAGDSERSWTRNQELLDIARATDDVRGECDGLTGMARLALRRGDYPEVVRLAREAREKAVVAGDPAAEAPPLHLEAAGMRLQRRYDDARRLYLDSLELNKSLGNRPVVAMERHNLGWVELHRGDIDAAEAWFRERDTNSSPNAYGDAWAELNWAAVAVARGRLDEARRRFEVGTAAIERLGVRLDPDDQAEFDWLAAQTHAP